MSGPRGAVLASVVDVPLGADARVYAEGWQSWSPTGWRAVADGPELPGDAVVAAMRFRADALVRSGVFQGEGLLVVDPGEGRPCVRVAVPPSGALDGVRIEAQVTQGVARVAASGPVEVTEHANGRAALASWGDALRPLARVTSAPRVWCTWYRFFERVTAGDVARNVAALDAAGLDVDVVQIDDGWSTGWGEGLAPSATFGRLEPVIDAVRASGRRAGIWLAPFLVGASTELTRSRPDWIAGPAGFNWGEDLVGLDLRRPGVVDLIAERVGALAALGVDYFKLDFLYGGLLATPGDADDLAERIAAYRDALGVLRQAAGPDAYLLGCGAPLLPSLGLVDAMRVSSDTYHEGGEDGSVGLRGAPALRARGWMQGRLWVNDPDCLVARPSFGLRDELLGLVGPAGGLRSFSDDVAELDAAGLDAVRAYLATATAQPVSDALATAADESVH